jgi:ParB/RepB/Spo0J family partition protein
MAEEKARDPTKQERKPVNIPLSKIHDLPGSVFAPPSQKSLEALTSSIVLKGVQEPVILRQREDGEFQIVSGNRRRKASEFAKKTEIPAFVYDMSEREAKEFRFRNKGEGTPPGKLLPESEIGKKREAPEKASDKTADGEKPDAPLKAPEKPSGVKPAPAPESKKPEEQAKTATSPEKTDTDAKKPDTSPKPFEKPTEVKPAPASEPKKPEEKQKTAPLTEKADADAKKPDAPPKSPEKPTEVKSALATEPKKPEEKPKAVSSPDKADANSKKPDTSPKPLEKPTEVKPAPAAEPKKPEEKQKTTPLTDKADAAAKKPDTPPKQPEKPAAAKPAPAYMPGPAALGPSGTKITKIFDERLMPPDEKAKKALPVPKEGESYFITLHPAYLEKSEFNTVSVDVTSDDYKELKKSIELNGVKDPVLTRINPKGGLEILSGQRRHMIARELNYPVPAIIQKIDDNDAMILVADANLHRPHISTYDLSRTLRNKMTAMKRKAGRKKRGEPSADELNSDEMLAKEMGISTSKLNRIIRLSEASKEVCEAVDSNSLELSIASALSFLKPENQTAVIDLMGLNLKPTVKRVQRLRDAEKSGKLDDKTMRDILEDKDLQPVKPPEPLKNEPPKPEPTQTAPPFPVASMVTPSTPTPPAQPVNTPPATSTQTPPAQPIHTTPVTSAPPAPPEMKPVIQEPPKQEPAPQPPVMQAAEKPDPAPEPASNVIPLNTGDKKPDEPKAAADEETIEHNSQRDNMYATKVTLGGDRLRRYFPDVTMTPMQIVESIYSALEDRRQREARAKQKTEILHPSKPVPTR